MRYLILLVAVTSALAAPQRPLSDGENLGSYRFLYSTDSEARSEDRRPDGTTRGAYTYVDDEDVIHEIQYAAGPQDGFKVLAHTLKGQPNVHRQGKRPKKYNDTAEAVELIDGLTPEVAAARREHMKYHESLRAILPEVRDDDRELPPVDPERRRELLQPVPVPPLRRNIVQVSKVELPSHHVQFPVRRAEVPDRSRAELDEFEASSTVRPLKALPPATTVFKPVSRDESAFADVHRLSFPKTTFRRRLRRDVKPDDVLAVDIKLVDGYTPEVAAARKEHLRVYDITRASLPELTEDEQLESRP